MRCSPWRRRRRCSGSRTGTFAGWPTRPATLRAGQAKATAAGETPPDTPSTFLDASHDDGGKHWTVTRGEVERFAAEPQATGRGRRLRPHLLRAEVGQHPVGPGRPAQQAQIVAAIERAVAAGMAYLEEHAAWVGRGKSRRRAKGIVAAAYLHDTSRALDPQLHFHVVVANMAEGPDGKVRTLDGRPFYAHAKTAGYLAAAELRHELATTLGWRGRTSSGAGRRRRREPTPPSPR